MGFFIGLSFGGGPQWRLFGPLRMMHSRVNVCNHSISVSKILAD
jgi:hypothetical protein